MDIAVNQGALVCPQPLSVWVGGKPRLVKLNTVVTWKKTNE